MKNISLIFGGILAIITCDAYAVTATVTSRDYVDNVLGVKQAKIPSAGTAGAPAGDSVITYTASNGQIGERALYTDSTAYDATNDGDKLITASALNGAFTTLPETETTKLQCTDSNCLLWNIVSQTAYGITLFNPDVSINGTSICYRRLNGNAGADGTCTADTLSYLGASGNKSGKWGVVFPYGEVSGISVCSEQSGTYANAATDAQSTILDNEYAQQSGVGGNTGGYCWCKMENPDNSAARWVFRYSYSVFSDCARSCAYNCANHVRFSADFRGAVFGN